MVIELADPPPRPAWPKGIHLRPYRHPQALAEVYRCVRESFRDHWGWVDLPFEQGLDLFRHTDTVVRPVEPDLWFVAMDGEQVAGISLWVRALFNSGFGEGWALYSERVADELGLYTGDIDRLGFLASAKYRAARMVLDAGIHTRGMGYDESVAFLAQQSTMSRNQVVGEVNRFISWPGQAPSYMIGNLEILRLRAAAQEKLGPDFDLREFHDQVLGHGMVTLPLLTSLVNEWMSKTASSGEGAETGNAAPDRVP